MSGADKSTEPLLPRSEISRRELLRNGEKGGAVWERRGHVTRREHELDLLVADFVGAERASEVLGTFHPPAKSIAPVIDQVCKRLNRPELAFFSQLREKWGLLVGAANAQMIRPVRLNRKCLSIEVANPTFLYVFKQPQLQEQLLQKIRQAVGDNAVNRLVFVAPGR